MGKLKIDWRKRWKERQKQFWEEEKHVAIVQLGRFVRKTKDEKMTSGKKIEHVYTVVRAKGYDKIMEIAMRRYPGFKPMFFIIADLNNHKFVTEYPFIDDDIREG